MANIEILSEEPLTLGEVKNLLEAIKKRDNELSLRSQRTYDYLSSLPINVEKTTNAVKKIKELEVPRLKDEHIVKIVNAMPKSVEELKSILQGYGITVSGDNLNKIISVLIEND